MLVPRIRSDSDVNHNRHKSTSQKTHPTLLFSTYFKPSKYLQSVYMVNFNLSSWCSYALSLLSSATEMLDEPDPPPSRLLLLPPEIRTLILEKLIQRATCSRGLTRVDLATMNSQVRHRQGHPPWTSPKQTETIIPVSYLRTCRALYEEGSHYFYSTSVFHFEDVKALSQFVYHRSFAQLCTIQHLEFTIHGVISCFESWEEIDGSLDLIARDVFDVLHLTRKLPNLQNVDLRVNIIDFAEHTRENGENDHLVQIIYRLVEHVNNSEIVTVDDDVCDCIKAPSIEILDHYVVKQKGRGYLRCDRINTIRWAVLHLGSQKSSIASPTHKAAQVHMDYVLRAVTWSDGSI